MRANQSNSPLVARVMQHANMTTIFRAAGLPSYSSSTRPSQSGRVERAVVLPPDFTTPEGEIPAGDAVEAETHWVSPIPITRQSAASVQTKPAAQPTRVSTPAPQSSQQPRPEAAQPQVHPGSAVPTPEQDQPPAVQLQPETVQAKPVSSKPVPAPETKQSTAHLQTTEPRTGSSITTLVSSPLPVQRQTMPQEAPSPNVRVSAAAEKTVPESPAEERTPEEKKTDQRLHAIMRLHQEKAARESAVVESGEGGAGTAGSPPSSSIQREIETQPVSSEETGVNPKPPIPLPDVPQPRRPRPTFHQAKESGALNVRSGRDKITVHRSPEKSGSQQVDLHPQNVVSETGSKEAEANVLPETIATPPQLEVVGRIQTAPDLETPNELVEETSGKPLGSDNVSADMDTMEVAIEQSPKESVSELSDSEEPSAAFSEPDTALHATNVFAPASQNIDTLTSSPEPVFEEQQGSSEYTSSEPITVVSRRVDPEQVEPKSQPAQLSPEPGDEPTMIIERRPPNTVSAQASGDSANTISDSGGQESGGEINAAPQPQTEALQPGFDLPVETFTPSQVTQPVQRIPEPGTTFEPDGGEFLPDYEPGSGGMAHRKHAIPPLQEVWPVKVVPQQQEARHRESAPKIAMQSVSPAPDAAGLQRKLASIPTARPSGSSVAIMRPRLPRQLQRTADIQTQVQQPATRKAVEPGQPVAEGQVEPPATVQTEIGDLPADLWTLIGQKPPAAPAGQTVTVQAKKDSSPTVTRDVVQQKVEPGPFFSSPPVIQRAEEQQPATEGPAAGAAEEGAEEGEASGEAEIDIDSLALQVFSQIKRRLAVEWERGRGRHGREW